MTQNVVQKNSIRELQSLEKEGQTYENLLENIFSNLYYTWDKDLYQYIDALDTYNWRKTHSPWRIIHNYLRRGMLTDNRDMQQIQNGLGHIKDYFSKPTWFEEHATHDPILAKLNTNPIVYYSAEYGLVDWLQIYSGGLGVLAGDFIKQASDHGIPMVGVGLFYHEGYFHQDITLDGYQLENYIDQAPEDCLLTLVKDENGNQIESIVRVLDHDVYIRAWELKVGRVSIYLLDTNFDKNEKWEDKMITAHLYGGNEDTRIRQEIVLGIGGYRFIKNLGIVPSVNHMNEGHASFVFVEEILEQGATKSIEERITNAKKNILFTNHTLNAAGNDKFDFELIEKYLGSYAAEMQISNDKLYSLGNDRLYSNETFSMTILGLRGSNTANAVSLLHGEAAKRLWPDYPMQAVTNGVHMPTWVAKPMQELIEMYVDKEWKDPTSNTNWNKIDDIPDDLLWNAHLALKRSMINKINVNLKTHLNPEYLTVVWTRRFAQYKRPGIFINDLAKLARVVNNSNQPVQFLIGGKAHPRDDMGKKTLQKIIQTSLNDEFKNRIVFMTGYNWNLARYLVAGADIWLNNPVRFEEASGTSGMKAGANGVLQFTTLDGWTDEVDWSDKGWVLPQENIENEIYRILEEEITDVYYDAANRDAWAKRMKETMKVCLSHYNMGRMLEEYLGMYARVMGRE